MSEQTRKKKMKKEKEKDVRYGKEIPYFFFLFPGKKKGRRKIEIDNKCRRQAKKGEKYPSLTASVSPKENGPNQGSIVLLLLLQPREPITPTVSAHCIYNVYYILSIKWDVNTYGQ